MPLKRFWRKAGRIVADVDGKPLLCDCCPCLNPKMESLSIGSCRESEVPESDGYVVGTNRPWPILSSMPTEIDTYHTCDNEARLLSNITTYFSFLRSFTATPLQISRFKSYPFFAIYAHLWNYCEIDIASFSLNDLFARHGRTSISPAQCFDLVIWGRWVIGENNVVSLDFENNPYTYSFPWHYTRPLCPDDQFPNSNLHAPCGRPCFDLVVFPCHFQDTIPDPLHTTSPRSAMLASLEQEMENSE